MKHIILIFTLLFSLQALAEVGKITAINGTATIERGQQQIDVKIGTLIEEKDTISTANNTRLQIIFNDKTVVTLGKNTRFSIKSYLFDGSDQSTADLSLTKGFLKSITGKIGKIAPQRFKVKTKDSTIGIRGTIFTVETSDRFTRLTTLSGETYFTDNVTGKVYDVPKNKQLFFNKANQQVEVQEINSDGTVEPNSSSVPAEYYETTTNVADADQTEQGSTVDTNVGQTTEKINVGNYTYSSYGYWAYIFDGQMTDVWAEASSIGSTTNPDIIIAAMASAATAQYNGTLVAFDKAKNKGSGSIAITATFSGGPAAIAGTMDYSIDSTRWVSNFGGTIASDGSGFTVDTIGPTGGSNMTTTFGTMSGKFYGPNAQETAGTFFLRGVHSSGVEKHSTGSFNAAGTGIQP